MNRYLHLHIQLPVTISIQKYQLEVALIFKKRERKSDDLQIAQTQSISLCCISKTKKKARKITYSLLLLFILGNNQEHWMQPNSFSSTSWIAGCPSVPQDCVSLQFHVGETGLLFLYQNEKWCSSPINPHSLYAISFNVIWGLPS